MRIIALLVLAASTFCSGCDAPSTAPVTLTPAAAPPPPPPGPAAVAPPVMQETVVRTSADQMLGVDAPNQKGADYAWSYTRVLFTNYFGVKETVAMGQVKQCLAFYEADHGHKPKTNEEGMEAIKLIPLPELPDDTYWYEFDPEAQELVVAHKEQKPVQ